MSHAEKKLLWAPALLCALGVLCLVGLTAVGRSLLPYPGEVSSLQSSYEAAGAMREGPAALRGYWRSSTYYPPGYPLILGGLHLLLGRRPENPMIMNLALLLAAAGAVYGIARKSTEPAVGLIAAAIFLFMPALSLFSRGAGRDIPLTCFVAFTLWALVRSDSFLRPGFNLLVGALAGAGLMIKWTFALYMAFPILVVLLPVFSRGNRQEK